MDSFCFNTCEAFRRPGECKLPTLSDRTIARFAQIGAYAAYSGRNLPSVAANNSAPNQLELAGQQIHDQDTAVRVCIEAHKSRTTAQ